MAVSFASEPEHWNTTRAIGTGAILSSVSASSIAGSCRAVAIEMVVAELAHLLVGDLGEPLGAEAERGAPQPGDRFDVVATGIVEHAAALAARDDQRAFLLVPAQVGLHVHEAGDVARLDRVRDVVHASSSDAAAFRSASGSAMP